MNTQNNVQDVKKEYMIKYEVNYAYVFEVEATNEDEAEEIARNIIDEQGDPKEGKLMYDIAEIFVEEADESKPSLYDYFEDKFI